MSETFYETSKSIVYDRNKQLNNFIDDMLIKCNQMFHYSNLPDTTPKDVIEKYLMSKGHCIFTEYKDNFYIFNGSFSGVADVYGDFTEYTVSNTYLNIYDNYKIGDNCVLMSNDCRKKGLMNTLKKYGVLCGDCEITLNMITRALRVQYLITASDNRTKESADRYIKDLENGKISCVGENAFLDGIKVHTLQGQGNYIAQFIELNQYLRATAFNELGLDANYNMKRERLSANEIELNTSILLPLSDDMLEQRQIAVEKINKKYGLNISVDMSSVWKMQRETVDKAIATQDTKTEQDTETEQENSGGVL